MGVAAASARAQNQGMKASSDYNAALLRNKATRVQEAGVQDEVDFRESIRDAADLQVSQLAASGLDVNSQGALRLVQDTYTVGEADARRIRTNYEDNVEAIQQGGELSLLESQNARKVANLRAVGSGISGAVGTGSSVYGLMK